MYDEWHVTVAADTTEANRTKTALPISLGNLKTVGIYFPEGCHGLVKCRVFLGEKPVFPRSAGSHVKGNDGWVESRVMNEDIFGNIPVLHLYAWNEDEEYEHEITVSANWLSEEERERELKLLGGILESMNLLRSRLGGGY